jgi:hypothetical protein
MTRLSEHLGERYLAMPTVTLCVGSLSGMACGIAYLLYWKREVGAAGVLLLGPLTGLGLAALVLKVCVASLACFAKRFGDTEAGDRAREALRRIKPDTA